MFRYTQKILIAASLLAFCSGQLYALELHETNDENGKPNRAIAVAPAAVPAETPEPRFQNGIPKELLRLIYQEASKGGTDPRFIQRVCKYWHHLMRYEGLPLTIDKAGIPYTTLKNDYFMEDCMRRYREGLVDGATLYYRRGRKGEERVIRFSDFKDGTADLSDCGVEAGRQVYTTSRARFLEVRGANEDRVVTWITPLHAVQDLLPSYDVSKGSASHVVMSWRWGNDENNHNQPLDFLCGRSLDELSSVNMHANGKKAEPYARTHVLARCRAWVFSCLFVSHN